MGYQQISWILGRELPGDFVPTSFKWRPKDLIFLRQSQLLLRDIEERYAQLELAREEMRTLPYGARYVLYLKRMRLWVRDAGYSYRADQLKFLKSVTGFYSDYGSVLKLLKTDQVNGHLAEPAVSGLTNRSVTL